MIFSKIYNFYLYYISTHHLKNHVHQGLNMLLHLDAPCALNNYEFMVYHVSIYRKHPKDLNEEKKI